MVTTGWKNALYGLLLLGGLVAMVVVPGVVSCALPDEGSPLTGRLDIGYGASIQPPSGARLDLSDARPGSGDVSMRAGGVWVRLTARSFRGDPGAFAAHARQKLDRDDGMRSASAPRLITTPSGISGESGPLVSTTDGSDRGCYAVLTAHSVGVVVLVTPVQNCAGMPPPVGAALDSIDIDAEGTS